MRISYENTSWELGLSLSLVNGLADFIEIAAPYLLNFRLLMKQIFENKSVGWNDEIPEVNKRDWLELIEETVTESPLSFPCSTRPPNPVGGPMIVAFSDGSFQAYSAVVYLRW